MTPMRYYCTYFDRHYLLRGLALYHSLQQHAAPFTLWVLCFDDFAFQTLTALNLPELRPVAQAEFERGDTALLAAKSTRTKVEYYFTCSPSWPLYLLRQHPKIDLLTYLDADLYFYASPEAIFDEMGDKSILIIGHRFPERLRSLELHGIYNVGLLSFRNDAAASECLHWWRERCLEWCGLVPEDGKFADQKYLDDWPTRFPQTHVLQHTGAGLSPWNWMNYDTQKVNSHVEVDGQPLIFYHYHGLKFFNRWLYDPVTLGRQYGEMPRSLRRLLYAPYVEILKQTAQWLRHTAPELGVGLGIEYVSIPEYGWRVFLSKLRRGQLMVGSDIA